MPVQISWGPVSGQIKQMRVLTQGLQWLARQVLYRPAAEQFIWKPVPVRNCRPAGSVQRGAL